jgi:hypothetical protein
MTEKTQTLQEYECEIFNIIQFIRDTYTDADTETAKLKDSCIKHLEHGYRTMQKLLSELAKQAERDDGHG